MARYDIETWLGDTEVTEAQMTALTRLSDDLEGRYEEAIDTEAAFTAGAMVILGDSTTSDLVDEWKALQSQLAEATIRMRGALLVELQSTSELEVSKTYGLNRGTVRKAAGK